KWNVSVQVTTTANLKFASWIENLYYTKLYLFFVTFCHREHRDAFSAPNSSLCALCELCGSHIEFQIILAE
ncbi:MAG: hypothetical protein K8R34_12810, partial [Methanosarcinales archaeon]|nr:hypothetical protein [Methanosarcinales archaeon]